MDKNFPWINSEIQLFDMTLGTPLHLKDIGITEVKWLKGNPQKSVKAFVILWEPLRDSNFLLRLTEESNLIFDLVRRTHGRFDQYDSSLVVGSFTNCEILSKWVEDLMIVTPDLQGIVGVLLQMKVDFKLVLKP